MSEQANAAAPAIAADVVRPPLTTVENPDRQLHDPAFGPALQPGSIIADIAVFA
jgi:hypothetical protein